MLYYLSLGANLGDREQTIRQAIQLIEQQIGSVLRCSSFYYSEPWGFTSQHPFCNLCCALQTQKQPLEVLSLTQSIERALGRKQKSNSVSDLTGENIYSDRPIDIDLIRAFDDDGKEITCQIINAQSPITNPLLTLPHPLWQQRDFVKVPLSRIMPSVET